MEIFSFSVKDQCIFVDLLQINVNFIAKSQLLYMGCPLTRERKQKKNPIFIFKNVGVRLRESVRLRECANTESDWKV